MAKLVCVLFLALLCIAMITTQVMAKDAAQYGSGNYGPGSLQSYQCPSQCTRRCGQTQYHKPCMFFCQKCCAKCLCVPPGYYGNKSVCPCYNNWKTKRGGPKCP
ncbi:putative gibberellin regulated protein [Medicago truncatula]|uniref:Gibberellin-regulated family protein n=1 Tax=Medicago truncatula TaxID=3880 RepID=I3S1A1_MEDTR|nr:gibberellin-regulated protein 6 [Medicago truncatula]AFK34043.1 unknown [Medicago truncatula]KEH33468.1 gibberellin-regulated family protein [Medicago truncatula]RHN66554.1 putative gibberellin regulated protein [Medicago truncatula]